MKRYGWRALLFFLIPIVPSALFIPAFAWDVTFHSMTWFLALSLGFIYVKRVSFKPNTIQILMLALIFIGTMVRKNGWFAALPLFFLALSPMGGGKGRMGLAAFFFILVPIMWGVAALLFKATPSHPENSIKTYDIGSISAFTDQNLFPGVWTKSQSRDIVENCYENDVKKRILDNGWDVYAWGRCGFVLRNLSEQKLFKSNVLTAAWLSAVFGHPVAYLRARLEFFGTFMVAHKSIPVLMYSESNAKFGWDFRNKKMIKAAYDFASLFVGGALFRPITWLILNFVAFVLAFKVRDSMARCFVCCVSLSGVVWLLTYFNFGVAYDFRYAFWAIYAALLSIVVVANELAAQLRAARFGFR
ncbi:hypothetical protein [Candidimonas nitroreducens]|uniref:hypothetical protein n=1 Tax=Candidimonas nitroreducens TaxID=683354 RepID=UPI0011775733|nr:hypothetical protein [Candidimonas nitroreducens]